MSIVAINTVLKSSISLSSSETMVLVVLASYADDRGGNCWPSQSTIAREARMVPKGVRNILARLEARGLLSVLEEPSARRSARYQIALPTLSGLASPEGNGVPLCEETQGGTWFPSEGNGVPLRGERGSPDPSLNRQEPRKEQREARPIHFRVLEKLAHGLHAEVEAGRLQLPDLKESLKAAAARARLPYDSGSVTRALDSSAAQRRHAQ